MVFFYMLDLRANVDDQLGRPAVKTLVLCLLQRTFSAHPIFSKQQVQEGNTVLISYKEEFLHAVSVPQDVFIL